MLVRERGSKISKKKRNGPAPSTRAASASSSGIVRKNKISIIGNGVVIDPWALLDEIKQIEKLGIKVSNKNLYIAENATLILPPGVTDPNVLHECTLEEFKELMKNWKD